MCFISVVLFAVLIFLSVRTESHGLYSLVDLPFIFLKVAYLCFLQRGWSRCFGTHVASFQLLWCLPHDASWVFFSFINLEVFPAFSVLDFLIVMLAHKMFFVCFSISQATLFGSQVLTCLLYASSSMLAYFSKPLQCSVMFSVGTPGVQPWNLPQKITVNDFISNKTIPGM